MKIILSKITQSTDFMRLFAYTQKAIIFSAILLLQSLSSNAATLSVALDGSQTYTAIQEAIDASAHGDIVLVYPGRYYENVKFNGKNISLASLELLTGNRDYVYSTIIDANYQGAGILIDDNETSIKVQGFTVVNGTGHYTELYDWRSGGGICVGRMSGGRQVEIINCHVTGNRAENGAGLCLGYCQAYLSGVSIHHNTGGIGAGIYFAGSLNQYNSTFDPVNRCSIYNNYAAFGSDLYYYNVNSVHVVVDTFTVASPWNFYATAIPRNPNISNPYTFDIQNTVHQEVNHDLYVAPWGDDANSGLSPAEPMQSIFMAMYRIASDSENPKTVHVGNGHYSPSLNGQLFPISIKSYTRLLGESREGTILDAESNHVNFMIPPSSVSWIAKNLSLINSKGGIGSNRSGDFRLENIEISNVYSSYSPKGISWAYVQGAIELKNVNINKVRSDRRAVAFDSFQTSGSLKLHNVEISNCEAPESMRIMDISTQNECDILIDGCEFHDNRSPSSDIFSANSMFQIYPFDNYGTRLRIELKNSAFYDNHQGTLNHMGMARSLNDTLFISNCSFAGNTGGSSTIAVQGTSVLTNNVFYNPDMNTQILIPNYISSGIFSSATLINNNILGGSSGVYNQTAQNPVTWGPGNTSHEPLFTAEGNRPYTLSPISPLIDAGWQLSSVIDQAVDAGGNERYWDGDGDGLTVIDVGAYEYQPMYAPLNLIAEAWQQQISLSWQMPLMDRGLSGFRIYRKGEAYAELPDPSLRYFRDFSAVNDTLSYYIVALYGSVESAASNSVSVVISGVDNQDELSSVTPSQISISPNPFKTSANIELSLSKSAKTQVNIYNIRGQKVRTLFDDIMAKGTQILSWDGTDAQGNSVCAGVYLARIESGALKQSYKMILLK